MPVTKKVVKPGKPKKVVKPKKVTINVPEVIQEAVEATPTPPATPEAPEETVDDLPRLLKQSITFLEPAWNLGRARNYLKKMGLVPLRNCIRGEQTLNYILSAAENFKENSLKKVQISPEISIIVGEEF